MTKTWTSERDFLHDISNSLSNATFLIDAFLENASLQENAPANDIEFIKKAAQSLDTLCSSIQDRRQSLLQKVT